MKRTKSTYLTLLTVLLSPMAANADPILFSDNGHWYEYVSGDLTWGDARLAALASSHMGSSGYLATVTSEAENDFLYALLLAAEGDGGWLGGTDEETEGSFKWADGPEAGQLFSYTNWAPLEPNECCQGEDYVHLTTINAGGWNDLAADNLTYFLTGYFVEYNAVPEPGTLALLGIGLFGMVLARRRKTV